MDRSQEVRLLAQIVSLQSRLIGVHEETSRWLSARPGPNRGEQLRKLRVRQEKLKTKISELQVELNQHLLIVDDPDD